MIIILKTLAQQDKKLVGVVEVTNLKANTRDKIALLFEFLGRVFAVKNPSYVQILTWGYELYNIVKGA